MSEFHADGKQAAAGGTEPAPAALRVGSPPDILAFVPHCLGFVPRESLVLMALRGRTLGATLRLDLPEAEGAGTRQGVRGGDAAFLAAYCRRICTLLAGDPDADAVLMVLYTDQDWKPEEQPPYSALVARLRLDLGSAGLELREGWLAGGGHWRDYFCTSAACCPWPGNPLDQVAESTLNAELVYRGSAYAPSLGEAVGLPPTGAQDPATARSQSHFRRRFAGTWTLGHRFGRTLKAWDARFGNGSPADSVPEEDGLLLASLESKPVRDAVLVLAALGFEAAVEGSRHWLGPETAGPADEGGAGRAGREGGAGGAGRAGGGGGGQHSGGGQPSGGAVAGMAFRSVLIGRSGSAPDWERLDRAHAAFTALLSNAAGEPAAALLTLLGWLEWARGRSSRAHVCLSEALRLLPGYRLAQLLQALLVRGELPAWTQSPQTAWHGGGG